MALKIKIGALFYCVLTASSVLAQTSNPTFDVVNNFYSGWESLSNLKTHASSTAFNIECNINECTQGGENCEKKSQVSVPREIDFIKGNGIRGSITIGPYINDFEEFVSSTGASFKYSTPKLLGETNFKGTIKYDMYSVNKVYQWNGNKKELTDTIWVIKTRGNKIAGIRNQYGGSRMVGGTGASAHEHPSATDLGITLATMYSQGDHEGAEKLYKKYVPSDYTFSGTLNYDQSFPIGISAVGSYKILMLGLDVGFSLGSKKKIIKNMEMTDILNYKCESYSPKAFLTLSPALFFRYISIGCGFGYVILGGDKTESQYNTTSSTSGSSSSQGSNTSENAEKINFILRPQLKGYIPVSEDMKLVIGGGYDFIPGYKNLQGFNISAGVQFDLDNWDDLF